MGNERGRGTTPKESGYKGIESESGFDLKLRFSLEFMSGSGVKLQPDGGGWRRRLREVGVLEPLAAAEARIWY